MWCSLFLIAKYQNEIKKNRNIKNALKKIKICYNIAFAKIKFVTFHKFFGFLTNLDTIYAKIHNIINGNYML